MKVLIVGSSKLPIPAVKGGAVPNLVEQLLKQNEFEEKLDITCCAIHDPEAEAKAKQYKKTTFIWVKQPKFIRILDKLIYVLFSKVLKKERLLSLSYIFSIAWFSFFVGAILHKETYDRVVFENSVPVMFSLKLWGNQKKYKGKYYLHMHSVPRCYYGNAQIIRNCKKLICISEYVADQMIADERLGIDQCSIHIMYNCIDTKVFCSRKQKEENIRRKYSINNQKRIIVFVGRLCREKGIEELLKAVKKIEKDIVLIVVGSNFYKSGIISPYEDRLRRISSGMNDRVIFTGYVDYSQIPQYYAAADVVVLPSMWEEPAGMTVLEAMACEKPVITTYSGGIPEYVGSGNCILLKRNENIIDALVASISEILDNKTLAEEMARKSAIQASRYDMAFYYSQFLNIING